ncbi:MAG: carboxypeptidase-like regulatory domain-containing protein [Bacteroidetes bacterium]|nr:carboxypeptidase-like regulatory domain-containing protein [Bacteroidota bacterium]
MRIIANIVFLVYLLLIFSDLYAQKRERRPIQFSGIVVTSDSLKPIPFTNIIIKNSYKITTADFNGFFSFAALEGDKIVFSAIGYKKAYLTIPDTLSKNRYSIIKALANDTIMLSETVIHPWPSREQFKQAFYALKVPSDDYDIAMKNLALEDLKILVREYKMDGSMNYKNYIDQQINKLYYAGQLPPNNLLNPIAWAQFIKAWQNGDFKSKD